MEKGKAYLSLNQGRNAIESFNIVATNYPNTSLARAASIQIALIYFNLNELDNSIQAYKNVIAKYPGSDEARTALEDLKAVYIEKNDIPAYAEYVKSLDGKVQFAAGEQDSLTFLATEKVLIKGNNENSKNALVNYLQSFANGAFRLNANMELARIYESEKDYDNALQYYNIILQAPDSRYTEDALLRSAEIYYTINKMQQALDAYTALILKAEKSENKLKAKTGVLRSNVALNRYDDIIITATNILRDEKINNELLNEAMYQRAISYVTLGRPDEAASDLTELAKDTRTAYGAEAKYLLAEEAFKKGQNDDSEHIVFDLIGSGTPHQYWLAKGFILLTDIYIAKGDLFQARQYLISLQTNYKAEDEINNLIADRFNIISEKEKSKQGE